MHSLDYGTTHTLINDTEMRNTTADTIISGPHLNERDVEDGVEASVAEDAYNSWFCHVDLPDDSPWEIMTDIMHINEAVRGLRGTYPVYSQEVDDATQVRLTLEGYPNDGTFAAMVREHEMRHVNDNYEVAEAVLEPWDRSISESRNDNRTVTKEDAPTARAALYKSIGGTPANIGMLLYYVLRNKGQSFHEEDEGKMPVIHKMKYSHARKHFILTMRHSH